MQPEIREFQHPLDRIGGRGRAGAAKADRLVPAHRVGQFGEIVVGAGIAAHPADRQRGQRRPAGEQIDRGRPGFERHPGRVEGRGGAADHRHPLAAQTRQNRSRRRYGRRDAAAARRSMPAGYRPRHCRRRRWRGSSCARSRSVARRRLRDAAGNARPPARCARAGCGSAPGCREIAGTRPRYSAQSARGMRSIAA